MSNFSRKEFEVYLRMFHEEWDRNALRAAFIEDNPDLFDEVRVDERREMVKGFRDAGFPLDAIAKQTGLTEEAIWANR